MSKSKMIVRTKFIDRACHWTVVICFFLVALSGIALFFPTLQWLTRNFRYAANGPHSAPVLRGTDFCGANVYVLSVLSITTSPISRTSPGCKGIVEVLKGNEHKVARCGEI